MIKGGYDTQLKDKDFFNAVYTLLIKNIEVLKDIENKKVRKKLPLPLTKEKFEKTSKMLQALNQIIENLDYNLEGSNILAGVLNDIGLLISKGNIAENSIEANNYYNIAINVINELKEGL